MFCLVSVEKGPSPKRLNVKNTQKTRQVSPWHPWYPSHNAVCWKSKPVFVHVCQKAKSVNTMTHADSDDMCVGENWMAEPSSKWQIEVNILNEIVELS